MLIDRVNLLHVEWAAYALPTCCAYALPTCTPNLLCPRAHSALVSCGSLAGRILVAKCGLLSPLQTDHQPHQSQTGSSTQSTMGSACLCVCGLLGLLEAPMFEPVAFSFLLQSLWQRREGVVHCHRRAPTSGSPAVGQELTHLPLCAAHTGTARAAVHLPKARALP